MKKPLTILFQVIFVLIGIGALVFMIVMPQHEGRNIGATLFEIYLTDPFLAFAYIASIPFFVGLYHCIKLFGHAGRNELRSLASIKSVQILKYCAWACIGFVVLGEIIIMSANTNDDRTGGVFMGLLIFAASGIVASFASRFEKRLLVKN